MPWLKTSANGLFVFKMVPAKIWDTDRKKSFEGEARGTAYEISLNGELVERWGCKGWHCAEGYLLNDGDHFVRLGPWASDQEKHTDLAIAFYHWGKLLKEYQVKDLIKKPEAIEESVSHYMWTPESQTEPNGIQGQLFHLVMIDKTVYDFDITTGEIFSESTDPAAKTRVEVWDEQTAKGSRNGIRVLQDSQPFFDVFKKAFHVDNIEAGVSKLYGVYFEDPQWRAVLTPRTKLKVMAITGDRLHHNTGELKEFFKTATGKELDEKTLRHWADIRVGSSELHYTSYYVNTMTGELLRWDLNPDKWPREPVLVDSQGKTVPADKAR